MDAVDQDVSRRRGQWTLVLTIISSLVAIVVEVSVISHVWVNPVPGHSGFSFHVIPVITALPLMLCLSMQVGVRKALKSGGMSLKIGNSIEVFAGLLILITYQAIGDLIRLIP
jgi:hypothetical protein